MKFIIAPLLVLMSLQICAQNNRLIIHVNGLENREGQLIIDVFNNKNGYPMKTENAIRRKKIVLPKYGEAVISLNNLSDGEYAIALIHDENMNGKLDVNFIGIPKEGVGASNNAKGLLGPPSYKVAKFDFKKSSEVSIKMLYY